MDAGRGLQARLGLRTRRCRGDKGAESADVARRPRYLANLQTKSSMDKVADFFISALAANVVWWCRASGSGEEARCRSATCQTDAATSPRPSARRQHPVP
ncbi:hypothetical protein PMIN05_007582 [Paraphaeosphaeria minitans]